MAKMSDRDQNAFALVSCHMSSRGCSIVLSAGDQIEASSIDVGGAETGSFVATLSCGATRKIAFSEVSTVTPH